MRWSQLWELVLLQLNERVARRSAFAAWKSFVAQTTGVLVGGVLDGRAEPRRYGG